MSDELEGLRRENALLRGALATRKVIELAKALLMLRDGLSEPAAHRYIQKSSMDARVPMVEIARGLIPKEPERPGRVVTAGVRRSPWPAAAPRSDSSRASSRRWPGAVSPSSDASTEGRAGANGSRVAWPRAGRSTDGKASIRLT